MTRASTTTTTTTLFVPGPNSTQEYWRGVQAAPAPPPNNIGAKEKWQPYLGHLIIYNHLGQISHTHKNTKRARAHAHLTLKQTK